jgi:glycosyltransferase involved in cell wall biosynthesis
MTRVGVISKFFAYGGVNSIAVRLSEAFRIGGFESHLVFIRGRPPPGVASETLAEIEVCIEGRWESLSRLLGLPFLRTVLREYGDDSSPDLLSWIVTPFVRDWRHRFDFVVYADESLSLLTVLANKMMRLPYGVVVHEGMEPYPRFLTPLQEYVLRHAHIVFGASPKVTELLQQRLSRDIETLYLMRPSDHVSYDRRRFAIVDSRWIDSRHPEFLFDIMKLESELEYVVAGSFPSSEAQSRFLNEAKRRGVDHRLCIQVGATDERLRSLYQQAVVYLRWPARWGSVSESGIGWGAIKALENGCPVVLEEGVSAAVLITDGKSGFVVRHDAEEYANRISMLASSRALVQTISEGGMRIARKFSVTAEGMRLKDEIGRLISRN